MKEEWGDVENVQYGRMRRLRKKHDRKGSTEAVFFNF